MVKQERAKRTQKADRPVESPQDLRPDDIAVHLLKDDDENNKDQALCGVGQQQEKGRGDSPKEGPEDRDNVGDAHGDADKHGVRHAENGQTDTAYNTDNQGVQKFTGDKAAEDLIDHPQVLENDVAGGPFPAQGKQDFLTLAHKLIPAHQKVDLTMIADDKVQRFLAARGHPADHLL